MKYDNECTELNSAIVVICGRGGIGLSSKRQSTCSFFFNQQEQNVLISIFATENCSPKRKTQNLFPSSVFVLCGCLEEHILRSTTK